MKVENLKSLEKLIKLCQRTGVESITVDGIDIKLGPMPQKSFKHTEQPPEEIFTPGGVGPDTRIDTRTWDDLTEEEKLFYSSQQVMLKEGSN